jgi:hypothetical protein
VLLLLATHAPLPLHVCPASFSAQTDSDIANMPPRAWMMDSTTPGKSSGMGVSCVVIVPVKLVYGWVHMQV